MWVYWWVCWGGLSAMETGERGNVHAPYWKYQQKYGLTPVAKKFVLAAGGKSAADQLEGYVEKLGLRLSSKCDAGRQCASLWIGASIDRLTTAGSPPCSVTPAASFSRPLPLAQRR